MKLAPFALLTTLWLTVGAAQGLTPAQIAAIERPFTGAKAPEVPYLAARAVQRAAPVDKARVRSLVLAVVAAKHPAALKAVEASIAENRPPVTPGNEHGQRSEVPPGEAKRNYGSP